MIKINSTLTVHGKRVHPSHMDTKGCLYFLDRGKYKMTLEIKKYSVGYRVLLFEGSLHTLSDEGMDAMADSGLVPESEVQLEVDFITDIYVPQLEDA